MSGNLLVLDWIFHIIYLFIFWDPWKYIIWNHHTDKSLLREKSCCDFDSDQIGAFSSTHTNGKTHVFTLFFSFLCSIFFFFWGTKKITINLGHFLKLERTLLYVPLICIYIFLCVKWKRILYRWARDVTRPPPT